MATEVLQDPQVLVTNYSQLPEDTIRWSAEQYAVYCEQVGADGIEFSPVRSAFMREALRGTPGDISDTVIREFHQSPRNQSTLDMAHLLVSDQAEFKRCLPAFGGLSRIDSSIKTLALIGKHQGSTKPLVTFPNQGKFGAQETLNRHSHSFASYRAQPTAELAYSWNTGFHVPSPIRSLLLSKSNLEFEYTQDFISQFKTKGYDVALDLTLWSEPSEQEGTLPSWTTAFPMFARSGLVKEIHVGPNRSDLKMHEDGGKQLSRILDGHIANTLIGEQLLAATTDAPDGVPVTVVIEMTAAQALEAKKAETSYFRTKMNVLRINRDLITAVVEHLKTV
jgi:hypothetical protein